MEKRHRCKLCFRNFANGRALGGHMRSHMMKFYAEEKRLNQEGDDFRSVNSYSSTTSSSSEDEFAEEREDEEEEVKGVVSYELRENPKKSTLLVDHDFSVVLQDRESETESSKKKSSSICRRSKRVRKSRISDFNGFTMDGFFQMKRSKLEKEGIDTELVDTEALSSISETTPEEHVAHCLIMLSRDTWEKEEEEKTEHHHHQHEDDEEQKFGEDYSQDSEVVKVIKTKVRGKYRCEACNKLFRSYQALGGHRASHRKLKLTTAAVSPSHAALPTAEKVHQCPFCPRVFPSGQALGGHKRSHFIANSTNSTAVKKDSTTVETFNIDLNLPAPIEDDEIAVSVVSDAEFVNPLKQ